MVAVTGIGMICPLGVTAAESWENMLRGRSGIQRITKFDPSRCLTTIGGQLPGGYLELDKKMSPKRLVKQTVKATRLFRIAAGEALEDAALSMDGHDPYRRGVIVGTSGSSVRSPEDRGGRETDRFAIIREMTNAPPAWISIDHNFKGPTFTISAGGASGSQAIVTAFDLIRSGIIDLAVAGGVDNLLTENNIRRGNMARLLSRNNEQPDRAMRPFDRDRDGFVLADGGCALVLESYKHAVNRNARVYAWIRGYTNSSGGDHLTCGGEPSASVMAHCMEAALKASGVPAGKIGYVSTNGISTINGDRGETLAVKKVFGRLSYDLLLSSQKSMIGHTVGGSGAIELAATALALNSQKIPPTINLETRDPECDLNYVPNAMVEVNDLEAAVSNTFSLSGHNCVIVLTRS